MTIALVVMLGCTIFQHTALTTNFQVGKLSQLSVAHTLASIHPYEW
jgi:hypothetical protein